MTAWKGASIHDPEQDMGGRAFAEGHHVGRIAVITSRRAAQLVSVRVYRGHAGEADEGAGAG